MKNSVSYQGDVWSLMGSCPEPLYLYGTGDGADKILDEMLRRDIRPAGIFVSEDFYRGQVFRGFSVTTLSRLEAEGASFAVVIAFGSHLPELIRRVKDIASRHRVFIPDVPVAGDQLFDASFYQAHQKELQQVRGLWADDISRDVFDSVLWYKLSGSPKHLFDCVSPKEEALALLYPKAPAEPQSYVDLGAYRGDTVHEFLSLMTSFPDSQVSPDAPYVTALEPDPKTFRKLKEAFESRPHTRLLNGAAGESSGEEPMVFGRGRGSRAGQSPVDQNRGSHVGAGLQTPGSRGSHAGSSQIPASSKIPMTPVYALDDLDWPLPPSYIKVDVEGAEKETLLGARRLIQNCHPRLNLALYHRSEDLFVLPLLIHEMAPELKLYLRRHDCFPCWDLNLYAVPE